MKDKILKTLVLPVTLGLLLIISYFIYITFGNSIVDYNLYSVIIFGVLFLLNMVSLFLVINYFPLLGVYLSSFTGVLIIILMGILVLKSIEGNFKMIIALLILILMILYLIKFLFSCIKDFIIGKQEIILKSFSVSYEKNRKSPNYYILKGKDINNKKTELKSMKKILNKKCELKIKYYKNIGWIESFEYLEK